jgi:group I intron endonuclease
VTNKVNCKIYIGQTIGKLSYRWRKHCTDKSCSILHRAIQKYGPENFTIEEIDGANSQSELNYKEWLLVYKFDSLAPNGYNLREGGGNRGKWHKDSIEKMRQKQIGKKLSQEHKNKIRKKALGKKHTESTKQKMRLAKIGYISHKIGTKLNKEERVKLSIAHGGKRFKVKNKEDCYVGAWTNQSECARDLSIFQAGIWRCLTNKQKSHKGYVFTYIEE